MSDREPVRMLFDEIDSRIENKRWVAIGIVSAVRESDRKVRVKILPDLKETNWIRLYMFNSGPNFISGSLPAIDSCVLLLFVEGHDDGAVCLGGSFPDADGNYSSVNALDVTFYDAWGNKIEMVQGKIKLTSSQIVLNDGSSLQGAVRKSDLAQSPLGPVVFNTASSNVLIGG